MPVLFEGLQLFLEQLEQDIRGNLEGIMIFGGQEKTGLAA